MEVYVLVIEYALLPTHVGKERNVDVLLVIRATLLLVI
jgi:hypothetical protein